MKKTDWLILAILVGSPALFLVNFMLYQSSVLGIIAFALYASGVSTVLGRLLYAREDTIFRIVFGVLVLLLVLSLSGAVLIILGLFTEENSLIVLILISAGLSVPHVISSRKSPTKTSTQATPSKTDLKSDVRSLALTVPFILSIVVAFRLLWIARTGEGSGSVWVTIPSYFVFVYLMGFFSLALVLFFADLNTSIKLALVCVFSFLSHSLFLLVWYPGRYGDPWSHLGEVRYVAKTGMPYAYSWILQNSFWIDLVKFRALDSLVTFFGRMFYFDLYWVFVLLIPVLWSVFTPLLAYKIAEALAAKRNRAFPFVAALVTVVFSTLVAWGAISVPNSLSFIFFFVSVALLLLWMRRGGKALWVTALLAVAVSFFAHPQPGAFAFMFLLFVTVIQKTSRKALWFVGFALVLVFYPLALYMFNSTFAPAGLFQMANFMAFQSEISTILLIFAVVGLILGVKRGFVGSKVSVLLFVFYLVILFEYYFTRYGMANLPYGPSRILAMADLLLVPLVALGFLTIIAPLRKTVSKAGNNPSPNLSSRKVRFKMNTRVLGLLLIGLFLSLQAVGVLYQAYPQSELVKVQPSAFELDAIRFIDSNSPGRYVVLDDTGFASLAIGFLGVDYGYAGGSRGLFGIPEWSYPTMQMYNEMVSTPSIGIMQQAMNFAKAKLSYFVVSVRNPDFKEVVERTSEILPPYRVFGDDQLYVFMYPLPLFEETGPSVKVVFDGGNSTYAQTKLEYMVENEINATVTPLTGYSNYTVTEFPTNWTFLELTVNNITRPFDPQSDINTVISVSRLQPSDVLSIKWLFNRRYPKVGWKEDSFKDLDKWHAHDLYRGTMLPSIASDGNILSMSYSFTTGSYWYYYYVTSVNVSTNDYPYLLMRWRCDRPVAVASVYFESGGVHEAVPLGSISLEWSVIVVPLPSDAMVRTVMVGLTNAGKQQRVAGTGTMEVDYILMASGT